jgi:predicted small metal-binding protein
MVYTTADKKLDEVSENIKDAIKNLSEVTVEGCWGADDFNSDAMARFREVMIDLIKVQIKFDR